MSAFILPALYPVVQIAAESSQQNPTSTPSDEATKSPYVFSTPIFIPTYTSATDLPATRVTSTPRPAGAGEQTYIVVAGDNPSIIAKKVYGDASKFRLIVEANNLTDATRLRVGTVLIIPPLTPVASTLAASTPTGAPPATTLVFAATGASPSPVPSPTQPAPMTPTRQPYPAQGGLPVIVETAMRVVSLVLFLGSLAVGGLAFLFYREARRHEKISILKRRLKGEK